MSFWDITKSSAISLDCIWTIKYFHTSSDFNHSYLQRAIRCMGYSHWSQEGRPFRWGSSLSFHFWAPIACGGGVTAPVLLSLVNSLILHHCILHWPWEGAKHVEKTKPGATGTHKPWTWECGRTLLVLVYFNSLHNFQAVFNGHFKIHSCVCQLFYALQLCQTLSVL